MGKKVKANVRRIKTSHKKSFIKRKTVNNHVSKEVSDINKFITQQVAKKEPKEFTQKIEAQSITFDELRKMIDGPAEKKKPAKLTVEDISYLENLLKRWGTNYERMAKDIRLNRMQWTPKQIEKKHEALKLLNEQIDQE